MTEEWRSVLRDSGVLCVMTSGAQQMLKWLADSSDINLQVTNIPIGI